MNVLPAPPMPVATAARLWAWLMLPLLLVVAMGVRAQTQTPSQPMRWEFCGHNSDMSPAKQCFDSLEKAEAWIRTEPASGPRGRKYLEQLAPSPNGSLLSLAAITYNYAVKPRGPVQIRNDDYGTLSRLGDGLHCRCNSAGQVSCGLGSAPCTSGDCQACSIPNGDITVFKNYFLQPNPATCNRRIENETAYPWPPIGSGDLGNFPNSTEAAPSNYGYFSYAGNPREYSKELTVKYETASSACRTTYSSTYVVLRQQIYVCDSGFYPKPGQINWRGGTADPALHVDMNEVCRNGLVATISARKIATQPQQCSAVGNPCDPVTGAKTQHDTDMADTSLPLRRNYNSLRSVSAFDHFGPGWNFNYAEKLLRYTGTQAYMLRITDQGTVERYDWSAARNAYLSATQWDALIRASGAEWELLLPNGERRVFDATFRLRSIEQRQQADSKVVIAYNAYETADAPRGAMTTVTNASGRSLRLSYSIINPASTDAMGNLVDPCASQASPGCRSWRVASVTASDGQIVSYAYDLHGNLDSVSYAGNTGRRYHYNEPANICPTGSNACTTGTPPAGGFPHHMTGISAGNLGDLQRLSTYQYDFAGRAISTAAAGGKSEFRIRYLSGLNDGLSEVTDPLGNKRMITSATHAGIFPEVTKTEENSGSGVRVVHHSYQTTGPAYRTSTIGYGGQRTVYRSLMTAGQRVSEVSSADGATAARSTETQRDPVTSQPVERRVYDAANALVAKSSWTYNARGQALTATHTDPATGITRTTTTTTYCEQPAIDAGSCPLLGLVLSVDGPRSDVNDVVSYSYRAADHPDCATSPATCAWRKGDLWKTVNALGHTTEVLARDGAGRVLSVKDANGVVTDISYHPRGWLAARKQRGSNDSVETDDAITRIDYWPTGLVQKIIQPDGSFTTYAYDAAQRLTGIADNAGNTITYTLDNAGNRIGESTRDASGVLKRSLSRVYNQLGQLATQADAFANPTDFGYDADGNTATITDALGRITDQDHDPLNRLVRTLQDVGGIAAQTEFQYDALDNLTRVTDPKGLQTDYSYNGLGDLLQLDSPDTGTTTYGYDSAGNRSTQTDARGITSSYGYDALNRLTGITYADASQNVGYSYDIAAAGCPAGEQHHVGRLAGMTDPSGSTLYCWNRFGQLVRKVQTTDGSSFTVRYAYSPAGQLQQIVYPDGALVDYQYNAQGQVSELGITRVGTSRQVVATGITYGAFGPITGWTDGNGRSVTRSHNLNYQPQAIHDPASGGLDLAFQYDPVGNLTLLKTAAGLDKAQYTYDTMNRLTQTRDGPTGTPIDSYTYDATGNRTSLTTATGTQAYTYPADSHRLTGVAGAARSHDAVGNTTAIGAARQFGYNAGNRMAEVKASGVVTRRYQYNGKGEQVRSHLGSGGTTSMYDEAGHWLGDYDSVSGAAVQQAIWLGDLPVGLISGSGTAQTVQYVQPDHLGSPRVVIDAASNTSVWTWDLTGEAFGTTAPNQDPDGNGQPFVLNMRFPGQRYDSATGLNYNYFRDYDPGTGRYVQSDPIGLEGDISGYTYVSSSPLLSFDHGGLRKVSLFNPENDRIFHDQIKRYGDVEGRCLVYAHGAPDVIIDGRGSTNIRITSGSELENLLLRLGCKPKEPVVLYSCQTGRGENSIAEQLSKTPSFPQVDAPTRQIWYNLPYFYAPGPNKIFGKWPGGKHINIWDPGYMRSFP